ncbi:MAG: 3D domain-containing protein [Solirubrobacterales bacterium]
MEKLKKYLKNYFSNGSNVTLVIVMTIIVLSVSVFTFMKSITVSADGKQYKIVTFKSTYGAALQSSGIVVGPKDKATPSLDSKVEDGSVINIKRAVNVQLEVDGKVLAVKSAEDSVEKMIESEGIALNELDKVSPSRTSTLQDGSKVEVVRVVSKDIKELSTVAYGTVVKNDSSMGPGESMVVQQGKSGEKETVIRVLFENGKEVSRKIIAETVKSAPVQKVVAVGTTSSMSFSRGGSIDSAKTLRMKATAYSAADGNGSGRTATGTRAKRNSGGYSSIAVDPRVIPLGSKVYVEGYGYAIAEDTGGAIKGNVIDVFFNSSSDCRNWGVRYVNVYVVD